MADREEYLTIASVEELLDDGGEEKGRSITGTGGEHWNVKKGRQGKKLWERWHILDENIGKAFKLTIGQFKNQKGELFDFVADFELTKDVFVKKAQAEVATKQAETRNRSFALAYAKDLAVVGVIKKDEIIHYAEWFDGWMNGAPVSDELIGKTTELKPTKPQEETTPQDIPEVKNRGALFSACYSKWGMSQGDVLGALSISSKEQIENPQEAFERIVRIKET